MNSHYEFAKQILQNVNTWSHFPPLYEEAGDRWHLETLLILPPFQVEKIIVAPGTKVPVHRHWLVDSFEVYVSGEFNFQIGDHIFVAHPDLAPHRRIVPISKGVWHSGNFPQGGQFITVQRWHSAEIPHITDDWEGLVIAQKTLSLDSVL